MNAREPQHDYVTHADLEALKADLIRELASKAEVERLRADLTAAIAALDTRANRRMGGLEGTIAALEGTIAGLERRIADLERRMGGLEDRMGGLESRIGSLEGTLRTLMWSASIVGAIVVAAALKTLFGW